MKNPIYNSYLQILPWHYLSVSALWLSVLVLYAFPQWSAHCFMSMDCGPFVIAISLHSPSDGIERFPDILFHVQCTLYPIGQGSLRVQLHKFLLLILGSLDEELWECFECCPIYIC